MKAVNIYYNRKFSHMFPVTDSIRANSVKKIKIKFYMNAFHLDSEKLHMV